MRSQQIHHDLFRDILRVMLYSASKNSAIVYTSNCFKHMQHCRILAVCQSPFTFIASFIQTMTFLCDFQLYTNIHNVHCKSTISIYFQYLHFDSTLRHGRTANKHIELHLCAGFIHHCSAHQTVKSFPKNQQTNTDVNVIAVYRMLFVLFLSV